VLQQRERRVGVARRQAQHDPLRRANLQPQRARPACVQSLGLGALARSGRARSALPHTQLRPCGGRALRPPLRRAQKGNIWALTHTHLRPMHDPWTGCTRRRPHVGVRCKATERPSQTVWQGRGRRRARARLGARRRRQLGHGAQVVVRERERDALRRRVEAGAAAGDVQLAGKRDLRRRRGPASAPRRAHTSTPFKATWPHM